MKKGKKLYEGKAKILYAAPEKGMAIQHFKDDATAFNNLKKSTIEGKGILNNRISEHILSSLNQIGIETHLIKRINMREQLIKLVEIIPVEFIVRNIAAGSLSNFFSVLISHSLQLSGLISSARIISFLLSNVFPNSIGIISTSLINCSLILILLIK